MSNKMEDFGIENDFQYGDDIPPTISDNQSPLQKIVQNKKLLGAIVAAILLVIVIISIIVVGIILIVVLTEVSDSDEDGWKYGVIVDLGSSGSRIHVFQWSKTDPVQPAPHGGMANGTYWYTDQKPGVSTFGNNPEGAGPNLVPLLDYAVAQLLSVNASIEDTPIFLFATAGLRLLPDGESDEVLDSIRYEIITNYQFLFKDEWARTISGTEEASFDWLTIQQIVLIEGFYNNTFSFFDYPQQSDSTTIGVIDLGGGSVEISFFPSRSAIGSNPNQEEFVPLTFDNSDYSIYGHSYLGLGHNSARLGAQTILVDQFSENGTITTINDPCSVNGSSNSVIIQNVNYTFVGNADVEECISLNHLLLDKSITCEYSNCAFWGVYQPSVIGSNFVGLDDLAAVCLFLGVPNNPLLSEILEKANNYCSMTWDELRILYPDISNNDLDKYCFEGVYIYELLTYGYGFAANSQQILLAESLYGIELAWALGAMTSQVADHNF